ncbi:MAG: glycosyltransferase, partial [Calditrichia bacterium]|nr:glycosyltransferase [Calditrichia bacterium]
SLIDNFPNTCLEALAFRRIVIGTKGTSFEQIIDDNKSGFLCNNNDSKDLLRKIEIILNLNENEKEVIQKNGYKRIQKLKPEIVVNDLIQYYQEIIEKSQND